jgi:hypothetical protein
MEMPIDYRRQVESARSAATAVSSRRLAIEEPLTGTTPFVVKTNSSCNWGSVFKIDITAGARGT